jgi:flagellin
MARRATTQEPEMASILTNTSAMVALQNLRSINQNLVDTQSQISTGKKIATAADNAAIWAVSKVIESDVSAFKAISDSLNLGDSTVAVARAASETVTDLLTSLKGNIVAAQEENVDRSKIQADIDAKVKQIQSIVGDASFNGLNLVAGTDDVNILSSLVRDSTGTVTSSSITVNRNDLTTGAGSYNSSGTQLADSSTSTANFNTLLSGTSIANTGNTAVVTLESATYAGTDTLSLNVGGVQIEYTGNGADTQTEAAAFLAGRINALGIAGVTASNSGGALTIASTNAFSTVGVALTSSGTNIDGTAITAVNGAAPTGSNTATNATIAQRAESITFSPTAAVQDGDGYQASFGGEQFRYVAGPGEDFGDVARGLKAAIDAGNVAGVSTRVTQDATTGAWVLSIDNDASTAVTLSVDGRSGGSASGGLFGLQGIDVTTKEGAAAALQNIDTFLNTAIDAAASFGSAQARIDLQSGFITSLTDSLKAGIGSLVDADLEEASARLQALQVQQQLGIQSLSIANQAPQSILALFR